MAFSDIGVARDDAVSAYELAQASVAGAEAQVKTAEINLGYTTIKAPLGGVISLGGWGAFDADNTYDYLNNIPFADHGALLDPPTVDVSARCISMLAQLDEPADSRA